MILYVRSEDGSIQQVEVTKDLVINPASGQQFYFDDNHGDFKLSLANDDQDVNLAIDVNGTIVNVYFSDMVPLLNNNDSALAIAKNENGTQEIQDNLQNQTFSGQEILDALNAAFEENNIALVQDFGSLTNELDAAAAGGENNSDSVNFITDAKIDTFDENSLVQRDRLEVENEEVGFIDSNGVPTDDGEPETGTSTPTKISVTVTLEDVIVEEGAGTATIGATLSSAPTEGSLVITLDNGATITFGTDYTPGDIVQSTPFVIQSDDVYNDAETYTVEMSGYTGGNEFESVDVTDTAKVTVSDTTDTTTMTLETSAINEDSETVTVTAKLDNPAQTAMTVTLEDGTEITIAAGASEGSATVNLAEMSDVYNDDNGNFTATVESTTGGNFENLDISSATVTTAITETQDTTTMTLETSAINEDSETVTVTAKLDNPAQTAMTVTLEDGTEITIAAGASEGSATVNLAEMSDVYNDDNGNFTATVESTTGGNFENLDISSATVTTAITETQDTTTMTLETSAINEDSETVTVTAKLDNPAQTAMTVTLEDGTEITIAAGASEGSATVNLAEMSDVYNDDNGNFTATVESTTGGNFENLDISSATVTTAITETQDTTTMTLETSAINEDSETVTVTAKLDNPAQTAMTVTLEDGTEITIAAGASEGSATVNLAEMSDVYNDDNGNFTATVESTTGGNFENLDISSATVTTAITETQDTTTMTLETSAINEDSETVTVTAKLDNPAQTAMTVTLEDGTEITIAAGASEGSATVNLAEMSDVYNDDNGNFTATVESTTGGNFENLDISSATVTTAITETQDTTTMTLETSAINEDSETVTVTAKLDNPAQTAMTVTLEDGTEITIAAGASEGSATVNLAEMSDVYNDDNGNFTATVESTTGGNFENLDISSATVTTAITETQDTTTMTLETSAINEDSETVTVTAKLDNPAQTAMTVTLEDGTEITIAAGASEGSATVNLAEMSDVYNDDNGNFTATVESTTGGNFENLDISSATVTTAITETQDTTTMTLETSAINEDSETVTVTAKLDNPAQTAMTVTLEDGTEITIAAGASEGSATVNLAEMSDVYNDDNGNFTATVESTTGGNFENLDISSATVTTAITETQDTTTMTLETSAINEDSETVTVTAKLDNPAQTAMTVTLEDGTEITIAAGASEGSATVNLAEMSDVYNDDNGNFTATVESTTGGNFENLDISSATVTTAITETQDTTTMTLETSAINEDSETVTVTAKLDNPAQTAMTVTLEDGTEITIAAGASEGSATVNLAEMSDVYNDDNGNFTATVESTTGGNFENLDISSATVTTAITETQDTTTMTLETSAINEDSETVTVTAKLDNPAQTAMTVTLEDGTEITIAAGASEGSATVNLAEMSDVYNDDNGNFTATVESTTGGNFENLDISSATVTTAITETQDTTTMTLETSAINEDSETVTVTAKLDNPAQTAMTVTLEDGTEITIAAGASEGSATVNLAEMSDVYNDDNGNFTATVESTTGGNFENLDISSATVTTAITETQDTTTMTLETSAINEDSETVTVTAKLDNPAQTAMTVTLEDGTEITIAAGASEGSATVNLAEMSDVYNDDNGNFTATVESTTGGNFENLDISSATVTTAITETQDTTTMTLETSAINEDSETVTVTAKLDNPAQTAMTVTLEDGTEITIAAGASEGSATVNLAEMSDVYNDDNGNFTATVESTTGGNFENLDISSATVTTAITETQDTTTMTLETSAINEDSETVTVTAKLDNPAQTAMTVTLEDGTEITIAAGASEGSATVNLAEMSDVYNDDNGNFTATVESTTGGNFENLDISSATVTTAITETQDTTTMTLETSAINEDSETVTVTAKLDNPAQTAMTVTLEDGTEITIAAGASEGSATVNLAEMSDVYNDDNGNFTATVESTTGGNFENLDISSATVTTAITETQDTTTMTLETSAINEDSETVTVTAKLDNPAQTAMTVTLEDGTEITIAAGASEGSATVNLAEMSDVYNDDNGNFTATVESTTGGNFENLDISSATVTTAITETQDTTTMTLETSAINEDSETVTVTAKLDNPAQTAMTVTLEDGTEITIAAGASEGSATVNLAEMSDVYNDDNGNFTATVESTTGGNFENLDISSATVTTAITETQDTTTMTLETSAINEDSETVTVTAKLDNPAQTAMTVTLEDGTEITIAAGASEGSATVNLAEMSDVYNDDNGNFTATVESTTGGNFENLDISSATVTTAITETQDTTTMTLETSAINEDSETVTVTAKLDNPAQTAMTVTLEDGTEITIAAGASEGSATVNLAEMSDVYNDDNGNFTATVESTTGGNFENLDISSATVTTAITETQDTTTMTLETSAINEDSETVTVTAKLDNPAQTAMTVTLEDGTEITIAAGASEGSATVNLAEMSDVYNDDNGNFTATVESTTGGNFENLDISSATVTTAITETQDTTTMTLETSAINEDSETVTVTAKLDNPAQTAMTVTLEDGTEITIAAGASEGSATVNLAEMSDVYNDDNGNFTATVESTTGGNFENLDISSATVTTAITETQDTTTMTLETSAINEDSETVTVTAKLDNPAQTAMTVTLEDGTEITIAAGASEGSATVNLAEMSDVYNDDNGNFTATVESTTGGNFENLDISSATVTTAITETQDTTTMTLETSAINEDSETVTVTAKLDNPAQTAMTVTLEDGTEITIAAGASEGSATVNLAEMSDVYNDDNGNFTATVESTTGGNFENLDISSATVTTAITETQDTTTMTLETSAINEDSETVTVTAKLDNPAQTAMTVTLEDGTEITIAAGASEGSATVNLAEMSDVYNDDNGNFTATVESTTGGNFENLDISSATVTTAITETQDTTTMTLETSAINEDSETVTVTAKLDNPAQTAMTVTLEDGTEITIAAGASEGSATVNLAEMSDVYNDDNGNFTATVESTTGGNFENLDISSATVTTAITETQDTTTMTLETSAINEDSETVTVTAKLDNPAQTAMTVTLEDGTEITIAAGASEGSATVNLAEMSDVYNDDNGNFTATVESTTGGNFENLDISSATVTTAITETQDTTTMTLETSAINEDSETVTVTAKLDNPAQTAMTVTLEDGTEITIAAGASEGSATVNLAEMSDVYNDDNGNFTATVESTTGGNFENLDISSATVTTAITETQDTTTMTLETSAINEDSETVTVTAKLDNPAQTAMTVTLEDGTEITIAAGASEGSATVNLAEMSDVYNDDNGNFTATVESTTGGNFENLDISSATVTTAITETQDTTTMTLETSAINEDSETVTVTAKLDNPAQTAMTVTLEDGTEITIAAGASEGSATVNLAEMSDVYNDDNGNFTATVESTTGGNFENLDISSATVTTAITETQDTTTMTLETSAINEDSETVTVTAKLDNPAQTAMTVTLEDGTEITIAAGASEGSATVNLAEMSDVYNDDNGNFTATVESTTGGNFENLDISSATVTTAITETQDTTTMTLETSAINEDSETVTVTAKLDNPAQTAMTVTLEDGTEITIAAGASEGSATVNLAEMSDVYNDDNGNFTATVESTTGGNFENLDISSATVTTAITETQDTTTMTLETSAINEDSETVTVTAKLDNPAQTAMTVTLEDGTEITIAAGASEGSATVNLAEMSDVYNDDNGNFTATVESTTGGNFENLDISSATVTTAITETQDTTTMTLETSAINEDSETVTVTAKLDNPAQTAMTVTLEDGTEITIAAGASEGSATVNLAEMSDVYNDDNGNFTATVESTTGGNFENLDISSATVTTAITETQDTTTMTLETSAINEDSETVTVTAKLDNPAQTAMTVTLEDGTEITIAAGASEGSATVNLAEMSDVYNDDNGNFTATVESTTGGNFENLDISSATVTTAITETQDTTTVSITTADVTEDDASVMFNVELSNKPESLPTSVQVKIGDTTYDVEVDADGKGSLTIDTQDSDVYNDASSLSAEVTGVTGGNYEQVTTGQTVTVNLNDNPESDNDIIETPEDTAYTITVDDFGTYSDDNSTQFSEVKITSLPDNGTLQFNSVAVTVPLIISLADIEAGKLTFNPSLHTDDDSSFNFQVSDGYKYSEEYTTTVNVTAVADAPTASIEIGAPTSTNNDTTKIVHVKAEVNEQLGDEVGDSNITGTNGYNYTEFAVENIDFGPAFANKVVELEMDVTINGSWNNDGIGNYHDDNWTVFVNGVQEALFKYTGQNTATVSSEGTDGGVKEYNFGTVGTSNANINNFNHKPVIQIQLDDEGKAEIKFSASTTETAEHVNINGIIVAENVEIVDNPDYNIYPVDIAAALVDTDGSETLSVQITDIPTGAILQDANGVNIEIVNGVAQIDVNGANSIEEGLTLIVPDSITDFDLNIVARATEVRDNEDGQNYKEATDSDSVIAVDTDPDTTDDAISTPEDTPYTITVDDFGTYSDDNSTQFSEVKITSLPDNGTLQFNGSAITVPLVISLAEIEAGKLTFNPSLHTDDDSSFNFQVSDGETYSDEHTTTVNVTAVADAPTASIEISEIQSVTIDTSNVADSSSGYSVKAYSADGLETTVSTITGTNHDGFGVSGSTHGGANQGASKEIGYDYNSSASEKLAVSFENDVASIDVSFAWKHGYTYNGIDGETAVIEFYKDGVLIESQSHNGGTDTVDGPYTFETSNGEVFDEVRFASLGQGDDYLINAISYEEAIIIDNEVVENMEQYDVDISAALADTDGSETLTVTITGVPDDAVLISDIYTLVDNGDNTWTVTVPAGETSISDSLKLAVPEGVTNIELDIVARATEIRDNEDGTNYEEATNSDEIEIIIDAKPISVSESQTINFADNSTGSVQEKNIVIILDNSGSMTNHDGTITLDDGTVTTRLALAKESLENLIDTYDDLSNVNVNLTTFGTEASYSGWMSAENAINTINNISSGAQGRSTNYEDALFETYDNYTTPSNGEKATVYFISDGTPTKENSDWNGTGGEAQGIQGNAVDNGYITKWTAFLSDNVEELNVIGIGTGLSVDDPDFQRVAQEVGTVRTNVMVVEDETELKEKLIETIYKEVSGNVLDNVSGGDGDISIDSITVDGHSYDGNDATNNILTLQTSAGGSLTLNFQTGDYTYGGAQSDFVETNEQFNIMVSDTDGDSTNFDVNINIEMNSQSVEDLDTWDVDDYLSNWEDINLGDIANLENYGTIDLAGKYGNTLNIDINDVLDNDLDDDAPDLIIKGNGYDDVTLTDSDTSDNTGWEKVDGKETIGDEQFSVYQGTGDASNIKVYIEDDLTIDDDDI